MLPLLLLLLLVLLVLLLLPEAFVVQPSQICIHLAKIGPVNAANQPQLFQLVLLLVLLLLVGSLRCLLLCGLQGIGGPQRCRPCVLGASAGKGHSQLAGYQRLPPALVLQGSRAQGRAMNRGFAGRFADRLGAASWRARQAWALRAGGRQHSHLGQVVPQPLGHRRFCQHL